jgi:hypothetical protein
VGAWDSATLIFRSVMSASGKLELPADNRGRGSIPRSSFLHNVFVMAAARLR